MNANLPPAVPTIKNWLDESTAKLRAANIDSARLDCELILSATIKKPRTYLHAHKDEILDDITSKTLDTQLNQRQNHVPVAYLVGFKEFYGRDFIVSPDVLIPRPESEDIISILKNVIPKNTIINLVDVGTGSGCLGITAKLELSHINVVLTDISQNSLSIAKQNVEKYNVKLECVKSDLLTNYHKKIDVIIANLPYVDSLWDRSSETDYEPDLALFADKKGLLLNEKLIFQASDVIARDGYLIIESDPVQHESLIGCAKKHGFKLEIKMNYILAFKKLRNPGTDTVEK